ncbi:nucleoside deaminase [Pseudomonas marginalis]
MINRRVFVCGVGVFPLLCSTASSSKEMSESPRLVGISMSEEEKSKHEIYMRLAIEQAKKNKLYPFGAVIVNEEAGEVLAVGVNSGNINPIYHGEMMAINDYIEKHGKKDLKNMTLYTTGEPCSMCMSAIAWCGIPRVVWASSIEKIRESGISQIDIGAAEIAERAKGFYQPKSLIAGVLADESDVLFESRKINN